MAHQGFYPLSGREFPRFTQVRTFYRLPLVLDNQSSLDVAIVGAPSDAGLSFRPGARFGPASIREASVLGRPYHWEHQIDVFGQLKCADVGDFRVNPLNLEQTLKLIESQAFELLSFHKRLLCFGGDHSITLPLLRAYRLKWGRPLALIHFDAHWDTYPAAWGVEVHHGSFLRHALSEGLIDPQLWVQVGMRGPLASSQDDQVRAPWVIPADEGSLTHHWSQVSSQILDLLKGHPVYITFDLDGVDPAYAPGVGTPVVGGFTSREALAWLRQLKGLQVVGADVVELSPPWDVSQITALLAMQVGLEILALMVSSS